MNFKTELLCIGNAIVDVYVDIDYACAAKYGIVQPLQYISREQVDALLNEPVVTDAVKIAGGGAANTAKIAAMLGMATAFSGCVGQDELAGFFERELGAAGVPVLLSKSNERTGICFICNVGDEVRVAASPGAALDLTETNIGEDLISGTEAVVLDGYVLERRPLVQHVLLQASRRGIPVVLDVASAFLVQNKAEEILHYSRNFPLFIFMNADEAITFFNTIRKSHEEEAVLSEKEKEEVILKDICPMLKIITEGEIFPIVVVKLGSRGAVVVAGGNVYHEETFAIIRRNTVGAGNAFLAAFLSAWIRGKSLSGCAAFANKIARKMLEVSGSRMESEKLKSFAKSLRK